MIFFVINIEAFGIWIHDQRQNQKQLKGNSKIEFEAHVIYTEKNMAKAGNFKIMP